MGIGFWKEIKNIYKSGLVQDLEIYQPLVKDLSDRYQKQIDQPQRTFTEGPKKRLTYIISKIKLQNIRKQIKLVLIKIQI